MNKKTIAGVIAIVAGFAFASSAIAAGYTFSTTLKVGSRGEAVQQLQMVLNSSADTQVASVGAGSPGNETTYFGNATKAAVIKFQNKYASEVLAPAGLTSGTGLVGAMTRAKLNTMSGVVSVPSTGSSTVTGCTSTTGFSPITGQSCASGVSTPVATGAGFNVTLASDSPMGGALVSGQALADLAHYTFSNNSGSEVKITNVVLNRTGVSNDTALANVYLYDGARRLTDSASVSSGKITFNDASGIVTIPAGSAKTLKVLADIAGSTAGQVVGVSLAGVTSNGTLATTLPVNGGYLNIASATLATLDFNTSTTPSATTADPQNDYTVWQNTVTVGTRALNLKALTLRNIGSITANDITNLRFYVDGTVVSTVANLDANGYVTFDLSASPKSLATGSRILKVVADIKGGSTRTFMFSLRYASDVTAVDSDLAQPVLATANGSSFSARSAISATINSGTLSVTKAASSPSSDIAVGSTNVNLAKFELRAAGENIKIENLNVQADTSVSNGGLDNAKVFFNGVQVGSTKDLSEGAATNFTFGSSLIVNAGTTGIVEVYADAKTSTGANLVAAETALITMAAGTSGNAQGLSSLGTLTIPNATTVPANTITVAASSLTASKYSGYGNQTMVAGRSNARIGSFVLSAGSSEGVNVDTVTIGLSTAAAASLTNLTLKDLATGATIGTVKTTPGTSNSYGVNIALGASGTKTVDVYADILTAANAGTITATAAASGTGTLGTSVTATAANLQTLTVGNGSLALAVAAGNPASANVIAGSSNVKIGQFRFTAANDSYTIEKLKVKVAANAATSTTGITLKYKNASGVEQSVYKTYDAIATADTNATVTFDGLTMHVSGTGEDALLDVYADIPTIASGASSGAAITATLDYNEGFQSKNSAGSTATSIGSADAASNGTTGYGTVYVRKTIPTFTKVASGVTTPTTGQALYKFNITADTASAVEVKKISLAIATTTMNVGALSLYEIGNSTAINTTAAEVDSNGNAVFYAGTSANDTVISVAAGQTKNFEVKGTVTNWGAAGDSMTISFTDDSAAGLTATSASHAGNTVWSDRSATSHTTITADWINSYLLKNFSDDVQSYSF